MSNRSRQKGFTMIELLATMAISGLLLSILVSAMFNINHTTRLNTTMITAATEIENAARQINIDLQIGQTTNLAEGVPSNSLTISWTDWTDWSGGSGYAIPSDFNHNHTISYSLVGDEIRRSYDSGSPTKVARHINSVVFSRTGGVVTVTLTSASEGVDWPSRQGTYAVALRPISSSPLYY